MAGNDKTSMSAEAQKLVELTENSSCIAGEGYSDLDVSQVLRDHPELLSGLNEYLKWRDEKNKSIGETDEVSPIPHSVQSTARNLCKKK